MADQWYYTENRERRGPVSEEQLKQLAASGQVKPTDKVWKKGMAAWQAASEVKGLIPSRADKRAATHSVFAAAHPSVSTFRPRRCSQKHWHRHTCGGDSAGLVPYDPSSRGPLCGAKRHTSTRTART